MSPFDHPQVRTVGQPAAEVQSVVDGDLVALVEQLRHQHMADIAGAAGDQNAFNIVRIYSAPLAVHECKFDCSLDGAPTVNHRDIGAAITVAFMCYAACSDPIGMVKAAVCASL